MSVRDEQCREIAKKLRYTANDDLGGLSLQRNLAEITKAEDGSWRGVMCRLADLIDRSTTRSVATDKTQCHAPQDFACERCGYWTPVNIGFKYCPECGAEVVDE